MKGIKEMSSHDMEEREESTDVLATKIEQILETVRDIKNRITKHEDDVHTIQREIDALKYENKAQTERMDKQERKQDETKKYIWGIIGTIITAGIIAVIKMMTSLPL